MNRLPFLRVALLSSLLLASASAQTETPAVAATQTTASAEAAYTSVLEKRTADILKLLELTDTNKLARVRDAIMAHYRGLRAWQDTNETRIKQLEKTAAAQDKESASHAQKEIAGIRAWLKAPHDQFLAKLAADLTPAQVDTVKDKMTYNLVQVTYDAFVQLVPNLTVEQKAKILAWLKEARELAVDGMSSDEKHAIFGKYKGRINNYLSAEGYDLKKASAERNDRAKASSAK